MTANPAPSFADRVRIALAGDSGHTAAQKMALIGRPTAAQTIYAWLKGGGADDATLTDFAKVYGVRLAWLRYGDGEQHEPTDTEREMARLFSELPPEMRREALDILGYQIQRATALIASERTASYITMIDKIKRDMDRLKNETGEPNGRPPKPR
jgi:hypothetical protein